MATRRTTMTKRMFQRFSSIPVRFYILPLSFQPTSLLLLFPVSFCYVLQNITPPHHAKFSLTLSLARVWILYVSFTSFFFSLSFSFIFFARPGISVDADWSSLNCTSNMYGEDERQRRHGSSVLLDLIIIPPLLILLLPNLSILYIVPHMYYTSYFFSCRVPCPPLSPFFPLIPHTLPRTSCLSLFSLFFLVTSLSLVIQFCKVFCFVITVCNQSSLSF